jgi:glycosyl hydrolase family 26
MRRSRPAKWYLVALAVLLAGAVGGLSYAFFPGGAASPTAAPAAASPAASGASFVAVGGLGLYDGEHSPTGIETAASWLGSPSSVKYAMDFVDATNWSRISDPWQLSNWKGSPFTMVWGVPMVPCGAPSSLCATNVSDFNAVASGADDGYYKTLARNLVAAGFGSSYIRLGWEFNATWMGWSVCKQDGSGPASWAGDFVPAFRNIVTSMRSVSGANFKFIWNPLEGSNVSCFINLANYYPGSSYVDVVALDVYDGISQSISSAARWTDFLNGVNAGHWTSVVPSGIAGQKFEGFGLNWLAAFGKAHDKEVGIPEWGLDSASTNDGGGDDAYFVTQMANWIKANATGPAIFWNANGGTLQLDIPNYASGGTPNATAAFKAALGAGNSFAG